MKGGREEERGREIGEREGAEIEREGEGGRGSVCGETGLFWVSVSACWPVVPDAASGLCRCS